MSRALAKSTTTPLTSPAFASIIPLRFTPKPLSMSLALCVGLIKDARPDFRALAPSDALIPPSFIAAMKKARSLTSPPRAFTTGATFGIAVVISSRDITVWFSTALRKSISVARSLDEIPKAFCKDMVVSRALFSSSCPNTDSFRAAAVWFCRSAPAKPAAAASAAMSSASDTATP